MTSPQFAPSPTTWPWATCTYEYHLPQRNPWIFNPGALEAHNILEGLIGEPSEAEGSGQGPL